ncbi:hypothetical protein [Halomonas sp.]|uniref:hypothetical protein n=1 Tax=Halomonas sp. TaxID=1486246 RepID=UPI003F8EF8A8
MKSNSFNLDRRIYELLQDERFAQFTTREMRDAYASQLEGIPHKTTDVRRYVYEQIRRMLRVGWLTPDEERRKRGQIYHQCPMPEHLQLTLVDNGFEKSQKSTRKAEPVSPEPALAATLSEAETGAYERLEATLKEVRLDFLASVGEAERYKQLLDEMPHLRNHVESEYREARDRSSRLLGHVQAIEKTINMLPSA